MKPPGKIYIARGFPGSGRTSAVECLRKTIAGLVFIDADPAGSGERFSDLEAHAAALSKAASDIEKLVDSGVEFIAVETCARREIAVQALVSAGRKAGYSIEFLAPAGAEPEDIFYCQSKSSHAPEISFLAEMAGSWESIEIRSPEAGVLRKDQVRRKLAWKAFTVAMKAPSQARADELMAEVAIKYPDETDALMLNLGPSWGRLRCLQGPPAYPLARICPYWAAIQQNRIAYLTEKRE